ncbi:MAG: hypothetical protein H6Q56_1570 [Deltaproteobacteria bacterium]|nr:hypothetical protein [Deltaproteobacteria bacterium]
MCADHRWGFYDERICCCFVAGHVDRILAGCSTTKIVVSWQDSTAPAQALKKPLVIAIVPKQLIRSKLEDEFVSSLRQLGVDAVASSTIFPEMLAVTPASVKAAVPSIGCDAILVTHRQETVHVPARTDIYGSGGGYGGPAHYGSFDSNYARSYVVVAAPAYNYAEKYYKVETSI